MRFYLDYGSAKAKRQGGPAPNALVIWPENGSTLSRFGNGRQYDGVAALLETPNSPVASCGIADGYLRESCKRVSKAAALAAHPALKASYDESRGWSA